MNQPRLLKENIRLDLLSNVYEYNIVKLANDLRVSKYLNMPYPYCLENAKSFKENVNIGWKNNTDLVFGIFVDNIFIGTIGLLLVNGDYYCGYWIGYNFNNKGYTTKALDLILNWSAYTLNLKNVYAKTYSENIVSEKVLKKNSFIFIEELKETKIVKGVEYKINKWSKQY